MAEFHERIKELRKAKNLKQSELADILGVSMYTVSVWERGVRRPEYDNLEALCGVFQVSLGYILGSTDDPSLPPDPLNDDLERASDEDEMESLQHIFEIMTKLSPFSKSIIKAAIAQAYKNDRDVGWLDKGFEVVVKQKKDPDEQD